MIFSPTAIDGALLVDIERKTDDRGFFARCWCGDEFAAQGISLELSQASIAFSHTSGTLRGLHFQESPHEETKLVRCTQGAAYVVVADRRGDTPSRGQWIGVELTAENRRLLLVPAGCAQGYQTLADNTELLYQMSQSYVPDAARGIRFDDPCFAISWPLEATSMSERDLSWPDVIL